MPKLKGVDVHLFRRGLGRLRWRQLGRYLVQLGTVPASERGVF
jgi:hypothetical protein